MDCVADGASFEGWGVLVRLGGSTLCDRLLLLSSIAFSRATIDPKTSLIELSGVRGRDSRRRDRERGLWTCRRDLLRDRLALRRGEPSEFALSRERDDRGIVTK